MTLERATKRLSLLKRIADSKWGCSKTTLELTYNIYILPLITYCCEPLVVASKQVIYILEVFRNRAIRLITGAVKSTPIDALLLSTHQMPIKSIVKERALLLWEKITRIPECLSLWKDSLSYINKNLKSQRGFLQKAMALKELHSFNFEPEDLIKSSKSTERDADNLGKKVSVFSYT
ncbi:uncharacterized protein TNIN_484201 [Trichonephila inaurata madagascariensis]|uniref:Uncharacterized protein n=1 Tax=Trichonephila inaurata madagascariensis TaxID=2747483 RepID=A0A8X6IRK6_9ARAC|nr:uncharacterized protein TNIN_484201 [Trichonephila inaurata madagascariensis]